MISRSARPQCRPAVHPFVRRLSCFSPPGFPRIQFLLVVAIAFLIARVHKYANWLASDYSRLVTWESARQAAPAFFVAGSLAWFFMGGGFAQRVRPASSIPTPPTQKPTHAHTRFMRICTCTRDRMPRASRRVSPCRTSAAKRREHVPNRKKLWTRSPPSHG
jgi:hypothetical protein